MSLFDKAKDAASNNPDKVDQGLDKGSDFAKSKTEGHDEQIDQASQKARDQLGNDQQSGQ
jgi:hypothetical protein